MPLDDATEVFEAIRRGARQAACQQPDAAEFTAVAEMVGTCLDNRDAASLREVEDLVRSQAPEALQWFLALVRSFAGTAVEAGSFHHLVLIPAFSQRTVEGELSLGAARHELERSLESALDLGANSLSLLPTSAAFPALEALPPTSWRALAEGCTDVQAALKSDPFGDSGGALVGVWCVQQSDKLRSTRKLFHATQLTAQLVSWQRRAERLLDECHRGSRFSVFPAMQLQDFFSGFRQIQLRKALEKAFNALPLAQTLQWAWEGEQVVCSLSDHLGHSLEVRARFPDEPRGLAQDRIAGFCAQRGVAARPDLGFAAEPVASKRH